MENPFLSGTLRYVSVSWGYYTQTAAHIEPGSGSTLPVLTWWLCWRHCRCKCRWSRWSRVVLGAGGWNRLPSGLTCPPAGWLAGWCSSRCPDRSSRSCRAVTEGPCYFIYSRQIFLLLANPGHSLPWLGRGEGIWERIRIAF